MFFQLAGIDCVWFFVSLFCLWMSPNEWFSIRKHVLDLSVLFDWYFSSWNLVLVVCISFFERLYCILLDVFSYVLIILSYLWLTSAFPHSLLHHQALFQEPQTSKSKINSSPPLIRSRASRPYPTTCSATCRPANGLVTYTIKRHRATPEAINSRHNRLNVGRLRINRSTMLLTFGFS